MLRELERRLVNTRGMKFLEMPGDLYAVWDILPCTKTILFLDAVAGEKPGMIKTGRTMSRALSPSFHQADLCSVVDSLEAVYEGVFPQWTLWGVTVDSPQTLGEGLTQKVACAVEEAVFRLIALLEGDGLQVGNTTVKTEHQAVGLSKGKPG
jgi:hydrogenase maturation protease